MLIGDTMNVKEKSNSQLKNMNLFCKIIITYYHCIRFCAFVDTITISSRKMNAKLLKGDID